MLGFSVGKVIESLPLVLVLVGTVALQLLAVEAGYRVSTRWRNRGDRDLGPAGAIVAALLGLLAFMLALTFSMAGDRFSNRKQLVVQEANAIGTAWLRARILPPPYDKTMTEHLERYIELRLPSEPPGPEGLAKIAAQSEALHKALWNETTEMVREHPNSRIVSLFVQSLNEVIDLHATRATTLMRWRIPPPIWDTLYLITILCTFILGFNNGLSRNRHLLVTFGMTVSLAAVLTLISDLDRPQQALFAVDQSAMEDLRNTVENWGSNANE